MKCDYHISLSGAPEHRLEPARLFRIVRIWGMFLSGILASMHAFGQGGSTGRILGEVTDQSGGVVHGATVSVIDNQRGTTRTLTTDDAGAARSGETNCSTSSATKDSVIPSAPHPDR